MITGKENLEFDLNGDGIYLNVPKVYPKLIFGFFSVISLFILTSFYLNLDKQWRQFELDIESQRQQTYRAVSPYSR